MSLDHVKSFVFYILPHHLLSRIVYKLTRIESKHVSKVIAWFVKQFNVNMAEAKYIDINSYPSFNAFFTRELAKGMRSIDNTVDQLACPVDGRISQVGAIKAGKLFQAKGHDYTALELLGGDAALAERFAGGQFATIYLSPRDYHRIHMPCEGVLSQQIHVPGRLFSVAPFTVNTIPRVFSRNERVVCLFETAYGPLAMILVGAMNVAAIETVWDGLVTPPKGKKIGRKDYAKGDVSLAKGEEMGRFNMGSTVILLHNHTVWQWQEALTEGQPVVLGELITR